MDALFFLTWTCLPGMLIKKAGPRLALQAAMGVRAVALSMDVILYLLPVPFARGPLLQISLIFLKLGMQGVDVVLTVFLVGVVRQSERGTLVSLQHFGGIDRKVPLPFHLLTAWLYKLGGVPTIFGISAVISVAMVYAIRTSDLMHVRLKEA
eukprot:UN0660